MQIPNVKYIEGNTENIPRSSIGYKPIQDYHMKDSQHYSLSAFGGTHSSGLEKIGNTIKITLGHRNITNLTDREFHVEFTKEGLIATGEALIRIANANLT